MVQYVTPERAHELFNLVNSKVCCPASAASPCIPFLYPDDGCWGRAHEMCRLMLSAGTQPEKVWIYGSLLVGTSNNPTCQVQWNWHVAPILHILVGPSPQVWVIDPSLFQNPVPEATWTGVQGDPAALVVHSDAAVFYRNSNGSITNYDPTYTETNQVLEDHRNKLKLRSVSSDGPPPYFQCMTRPPGTQWFGTLAPSQTARWFTWGWPSSWHVVWTVMPSTPCIGGPQLSWKVEVERANASQCTYWITVRNLTSDPVKFEGRYDVLSY